MSKDTEELQKLVKLLRDALERDKALREKYEVGDKFRFVRDRLNATLAALEAKIPDANAEQMRQKSLLGEDEVPVYVYLYNAQGLQFRSWIGMCNPKLYYEYSVNRPIYAEKEFVEALLRSKTNKTQHAYLAVAVKKANVIKGDLKDAQGNPLIKVKEGSLNFDKTLGFTHNGQEYEMNSEGELVKK